MKKLITIFFITNYKGFQLIFKIFSEYLIIVIKNIYI